MPWRTSPCDVGKRTTRVNTSVLRRRWEEHFRVPWDRRYQMCHHCDEPRCANPLHIFAGTQTDNLRDAHQKGRLRGSIHGSGEDHRFSKLTSAQVEEIRHLIRQEISQAALAAEYGVSQSAISRIKTGKRWGGSDAVAY